MFVGGASAALSQLQLLCCPAALQTLGIQPQVLEEVSSFKAALLLQREVAIAPAPGGSSAGAMPQEELPDGAVAAALELLEQGACLGRRRWEAAIGGWWPWRACLWQRAVRWGGQPASS